MITWDTDFVKQSEIEYALSQFATIANLSGLE